MKIKWWQLITIQCTNFFFGLHLYHISNRSVVINAQKIGFFHFFAKKFIWISIYILQCHVWSICEIFLHVLKCWQYLIIYIIIQLYIAFEGQYWSLQNDQLNFISFSRLSFGFVFCRNDLLINLWLINCKILFLNLVHLSFAVFDHSIRSILDVSRLVQFYLVGSWLLIWFCLPFMIYNQSLRIIYWLYSGNFVLQLDTVPSQ